MTRTMIILVATMAMGLPGTPALATQVAKTWVSSQTGNDSGTCQFVAPCKTFAFALAQTLPGGEIDVKDGGSYGPVTINQAVSIVSAGVVAEISIPSQGTGVTVAAGTNDKVILQGLVIDGHGSGKYGIDFHSGASLTVAQCQIRNVLIGADIYGNAAIYHILDTIISTASSYDIFVSTNAITSGSLYNVHAYDSPGDGLAVFNSNVTVIDSTFSGNHNGITTHPGGNVLLGQSTVSGNTTGIDVGTGVVGSYGNNYINANLNDISGTLGFVAAR